MNFLSDGFSSNDNTACKQSIYFPWAQPCFCEAVSSWAVWKSRWCPGRSREHPGTQQQLGLYAEIKDRYRREGLDSEAARRGDLGRQGCVKFPFGSAHHLLTPRKRGLEAEIDDVVHSEEIANLRGKGAFEVS